MSITVLRAAHRVTGAAWLCLIGVLLGLVVINAVGPRLGYQLMVIRGGSMDPSIPLGSVVAIQHVDPAGLVVGDVISIQTTTGTVYSHRIHEIRAIGDGPAFVLQGDANPAPDEALVPGAAVIGRVVVAVPWVGYLVALLMLPTGLVGLTSGLASLLLAFWLLQDLRDEARRVVVAAASSAGGTA